MRLRSYFTRRDVLLLCLLLPGLALRLYIAIQPLSTLLVKVLPDDAFYYFTIARNIVEGHGSTFDRLRPTNGYHPFWMVALLPCFAMFSGASHPLNAALSASSLMSFITAYVIYRILRLARCRWYYAMASSILYFYSPYVILFSVNGLETAVSALVLAVTGLWFVWLSRRPCHITCPSESIVFGLLLGLCVLARTDLVLFALPASLAIILKCVWQRNYRAGVLIVVSGAIVVAPWIVWNYIRLGDFVQVSGKALSVYAYRDFAIAHPGAGLLDSVYVTEFKRRLLGGFIKFGFYLGVVPVRWEDWKNAWLLAWAIPLGYIVICLGSVFTSRRTAVRKLLLVWPMLIVLPLYVVVHEGFRWAGREWYAGTVAPAAFVLLGLTLSSLAVFGKRFAFAGTILVLGVAVAVSGRTLLQAYQAGLYGHQKGFNWAVDDVNQRFPHGAVIGSSDAGYLGYMARNHRIVNLDGLVNNSAYHFMRQGNLLKYMQETNMYAFYVRESFLKDAYLGPGWQTEVTTSLPWYILKNSDSRNGKIGK